MDSYLLAVTPPLEICARVDEYRKKYAEFTSYTIPPHITIYPPFLIKSLPEEVTAMISGSLNGFDTQEITLDSISYFENGNDFNVAYFKPDEPSILYLRELMRIIRNCIQESIEDKYDYHSYDTEAQPHMTIASQIPDTALTYVKERLENTEEIFKFIVNSLDLYEQKEASKEWRLLKKIAFGSSQSTEMDKPFSSR